ncbi:MAG: hypothetical protein IJK75_08365 [Bacteroidales bacterium]|nr:hypothetical protein [Bacteroidales bacterium]
MKNRLAIITILIASAAMLLSGCDQTQEMDGKKVQFSARSKGYPSTKTSYSAYVTENNTVYQRINWEDGDRIRIYNPEKEGNLWAPDMTLVATVTDPNNPFLKLAYSDYVLREGTSDNRTISHDGRYSKAKLFNNGDNGLTWTGNTATFYGIYPIDQNRLVPHALVEDQSQQDHPHLLMEIKIPGAGTGTDVQTGDSTFVSTMPLLAKNTVANGGQVTLDFYPYFSAYEFNLKSKDQDVTITSLTVSAQTGFISGHYYWDLTADTPDGAIVPGLPKSNLGTQNPDTDRTITISGSWTATTTQDANITIFGLPNDLGKITLTIKCTVGGSPATATLYLGDDIKFDACKKTRIKGLQIGGVWKIFIAAVGVDEWQEVGTTTLII